MRRYYRDRKLKFMDWQSFMDKDPSGRDFYCASKIMPRVETCDNELATTLLSKEEVYLDSVMVADVVGKKQNYNCYPREEGLGQIMYLDLGCNFVYAKDGFITLPARANPYNARDFKVKMRKLEKEFIISKKDDFVNLGELVAGIPVMPLPTLRPFGKSPVCFFLDNDEIHEIQSYIADSLLGNLSRYESEGLLVEQ